MKKRKSPADRKRIAAAIIALLLAFTMIIGIALPFVASGKESNAIVSMYEAF